MKIIFVTATNSDGEVLDRTSLEIPNDHCTLAITSHDTTIPPRACVAELAIGKEPK